MTLRQFYPRERGLGGLLGPQRVQPAKSKFLGNFRVFGRILELHFFRFRKNNFFTPPYGQQVMTGQSQSHEYGFVFLSKFMPTSHCELSLKTQT